MNLLTKFYEDQTINVASRVLTRFNYSHIKPYKENAPPLGSHVFQANITIFDSSKISLKPIFVASRELTRQMLTPHNGRRTKKRSQKLTMSTLCSADSSHPQNQHKFAHLRRTNQQTNRPTNGQGKNNMSPTTIVGDIKIVTSRFHDDLAKIVTSRVQGTKLSQNQETNVLTKFHENWAKNVTSRVFTCFHYVHIEENAPPTGGHVFSPIWTIFELVRDINKTNVLTNFHDDWAKIKTSRVFTSHVIKLTGTIFKLNSHIKETNVLTKFHENWTKNVTSRVFTCFHYIHIEKNAPPTGGHFFHRSGPFSNSSEISIKPMFFNLNKENCPAHWRPCFSTDRNHFDLDQHIIKANILTNFELDRDIIGTNLLTKFHEDRT
ncbi:hypothetical protein DPMN_042437 [Dreissena polymorpha]|uniref:Uncharacterized protein n=1 Tax=Dreissena polymorpha TaxID=45954 RepID=A0A9D4HWY6_DREPO|nr:hypothetical protein DPMN_042437 [Dreissena polymorpha]